MTTMLRVLTLLWLSATNLVQSQQNPCSLCLDDAPANLTKTIGGTPKDPSCSEFATNVEMDEAGCRSLQVLGYRWCDCPTYPEEYFCPMCKNSFYDIPNRFKEIPGMGKTCDDRLFVPKDSVTSCLEAMKPGYACGCPDADLPFCTVCGGSSDQDFQLTNPDGEVTINGVGSYTCKELVELAVLGSLSLDQCTLVQSGAFDVCGCSGTTTDTDKDNATDVPAEEEIQSPPEDNSSDSAPSTRRQQLTVMTTFLGVLVSQMV